jgi:hypothetical protein
MTKKRKKYHIEQSSIARRTAEQSQGWVRGSLLGWDSVSLRNLWSMETRSCSLNSWILKEILHGVTRKLAKHAGPGALPFLEMAPGRSAACSSLKPFGFNQMSAQGGPLKPSCFLKLS